MHLDSEKSIILDIGNLRLSDTDNTFKNKIMINGIEYNPLINPNKRFEDKNISAEVVFGHHRHGVKINQNKNSLLLAYGTNKLTSNAQSMAIGYFDGIEYFFITEIFNDIYAEKRGEQPKISQRVISRCYSLWDNYIEHYLVLYLGNYKNVSKENLVKFKKLLTRIDTLKESFSEENLNELRKVYQKK